MASASVLLPRRLAAEFLGSAFLAAVVIGSGIAAQRLSPGDTGLELLENAAATAAGLFAVILMFGPVSGAHFNPVVSFADAALGGLSWRDAVAYLPAQVAGCVTGAVAANLMFAESAVSISAKHRASGAHALSEVIATAGLVLVIFALARRGRLGSARRRSAPTSAPPLLVHLLHQLRQPRDHHRPHVLRHLRGYRPLLGSVVHRRPQVGGGIAGVLIIRFLYPALAAGVIVPHESADSRAAPDGDEWRARRVPGGIAR